MRILVIGAGALGGYFGACMTRAGRDVTFLARPKRAGQLAHEGLRVVISGGGFTVPAATILASDLREPFDLILVGVKSYSLPEAMDQFAPAVGATTAILPVLNGIAHLDRLRARFGTERVLGGLAQLSATLNSAGHIVHNLGNELIFGEIAGGFSDRSRALSALFEVDGFEARASDVILQDMWEKFVQIGAGAGINCLMRGSLGDILAVPGGREAILNFFAECSAIAAAAGYAPRPAFVERITALMTTPGLPVKASMLRDIERGSVTEGDHILGDLAERARGFGVATPILDLARIHVATYEAGRAREAAAAGP